MKHIYHFLSTIKGKDYGYYMLQLLHASLPVVLGGCEEPVAGASGSIERIKRKIYTCSIKYQYTTVTGNVHKMNRCITLPVVFDAGGAEDPPLASSRSVTKNIVRSNSSFCFSSSLPPPPLPLLTPQGRGGQSPH